MAEYIAIPKLGMTMTEAKLLEWKVKEGEWVEARQAVVEIETEKVKADVEATAQGFVHILVSQSQKVPVGRVVGLLAESKGELETLQKEPAKEIYTAAAEVAVTEIPEVMPRATGATMERMEGRIRISPVARKMAEEHMIDITKVSGSGPGGRIVREDVERAIELMKREAPPAGVYQSKRVKTTIPLEGMRKSIAEHMHSSLTVAAQLTCMGEVDMTEVIKLRNIFLEQKEVIGTKLTYTDIFVFTIAHALKDNPIINSSLIKDEIKIWEDINIGVAVALGEGIESSLIVPVVRNADQKSLLEISRELRSLVDKARTGKLTFDDISGGTFTLTNLGALGGGYRFETVVINQPESAILGTGGITDRVVARDDQIVIRPIMTYYFTYDHRIIMGATAAEFAASVTKLLENPYLLLQSKGPKQ